MGYPSSIVWLALFIVACSGAAPATVAVDATVVDAGEDAAEVDEPVIRSCAFPPVVEDDRARLLALVEATEAYARRYGRMPPYVEGSTPTQPCCSHNYLGTGCCLPHRSYWAGPAHPGWIALGFSVDQASATQFTYYGSENGQTAQIIAVRDTDCDSFALADVADCTMVDRQPRCTIVYDTRKD